LLSALAAVTWLPACLLVICSPIPDAARGLLAVGLAGAVASEIRGWCRRPELASWRPGGGWILEWPDGTQRPARLLGTSRVFPGLLTLSWSLASGRRVNLLLLPRRGDATNFRRLRVLLRYGRANG
jgi:hypothetical protein